MTDFFDAAEWRNIPRRAYAAVYADGRFVAPAAGAYARFAKVRWITVWGGSNAAKYAGCLDWEEFNANFPNPDNMIAWAQGRRDMNCLARVYSDDSNLGQVHSAVGHLDNVRYWIADYNGKAGSAGELAARVAHFAPIPADRIWAQQYAGDATGGVDDDVLFGPW